MSGAASRGSTRTHPWLASAVELGSWWRVSWVGEVIYGIEPNEAMIRTASRNFKGRSDVVLPRARAERIPLADGSVDVALSNMALNHVPGPHR